MRTYKVDTIADYFLARANPEIGDLLSNLKLQKLCYYAAGVSAAVRRNDAVPLFAEPIEAWQHGPVVPVEYHRFKAYGGNSIDPIMEFDAGQIDTGDKLILDDIYNYYGQYSAWKLRNMTHEERPWIEAFNRADKTISVAELRQFFSTDVSEDYIRSYHEAQSGYSEAVQ